MPNRNFSACFDRVATRTLKRSPTPAVLLEAGIFSLSMAIILWLSPGATAFAAA